jgi:hypothetical protein
VKGFVYAVSIATWEIWKASRQEVPLQHKRFRAGYVLATYFPEATSQETVAPGASTLLIFYPQDRPGSEPRGSTVSPNVEFSVDPAPHEMLIRQQPGFGKSTIDGNCWYPAPAILRVTTGVAASAGCARSVN